MFAILRRSSRPLTGVTKAVKRSADERTTTDGPEDDAGLSERRFVDAHHATPSSTSRTNDA